MAIFVSNLVLANALVEGCNALGLSAQKLGHGADPVQSATNLSEFIKTTSQTDVLVMDWSYCSGNVTMFVFIGQFV